MSEFQVGAPNASDPRQGSNPLPSRVATIRLLPNLDADIYVGGKTEDWVTFMAPQGTQGLTLISGPNPPDASEPRYLALE